MALLTKHSLFEFSHFSDFRKAREQSALSSSLSSIIFMPLTVAVKHWRIVQVAEHSVRPRVEKDTLWYSTVPFPLNPNFYLWCRLHVLMIQLNWNALNSKPDSSRVWECYSGWKDALQENDPRKAKKGKVHTTIFSGKCKCLKTPQNNVNCGFVWIN